jgi:CSLREA domain-containing protein
MKKIYLSTSSNNTGSPKVFFRTGLLLFFTLIIGTFLAAPAFGRPFVVTKVDDTNDGVCDADCSLKEAVGGANTAGTDDTIEFDQTVFNVPRTISLGTASLMIAQAGSLTFNGPGMNLLTIDCNINTAVASFNNVVWTINNLTISGSLSGTSGRIYNATGGNLTVSNVSVMNSGDSLPGVWNVGTVTVQNSSITNNKGSGIYNDQGNVTVINSMITDNRGGVSNDRGTANVSFSTMARNTGPGFSNTAGNATLDHVTITDNTRTGFRADGAGVWSWSDGTPGPTVNITNSVIKNNTIDGENSAGGAIVNYSATMNIGNSAIIGNQSVDSNGGGIFNAGVMSITNTTISGNTSALDGGGIYARGNTTLNHVTLSRNTANRGGGVFRDASSAPVVNLHGSTIGDNTAVSNPDALAVFTSQGYNLIENTTGTTFTGTTAGNILGRDPGLVPARLVDGTEVVPLQPGSLAVDTADPANFPATDQRGTPRAQDGNMDGSSLPDIGAFERKINVVYTVTKTADVNDGACDSDCSLREAISTANTAAGDNVIIFDPLVFNSLQTITLTLDELRIVNSGSLALLGPGSGLLTLSGNNSSRVVFLDQNSVALISGLKITGGNGTGPTHVHEGGGILNNGGYLELKRSIVSNNSVNFTLNGRGGGVTNSGGGKLAVNESAISSNGAFTGGGIFNNNNGSTLVVSDSSIQNNTSAEGGGIYNLTTAEINNSLISDNTANQGNGGGIFNHASSVKVSLTNTTVFHNSASGSGGGIVNSAPMDILRSTIGKNSSSADGGGISHLNGALAITASTIYENTAPFGGGIRNSAALTLLNSTVSTNSATGLVGGGGIYSEIPGGAGVVTLGNATIAKNTAAFGGGVVNSSGTMNSRNSLFGDNVATTGFPDFSGIITSQGHNLIENTAGTTVAGNTTGNITDEDPRLAILSNTGGPTMTHMLLRESPAVDTGSTPTIFTTDQRGFTRPRDGDRFGAAIQDIGSVERDPLLDASAPFDYDGDGRADISVFRPSEGNWYIQNSSDQTVTGLHFGLINDLTAPGDFDGDGKADISVFRPSEGNWYRLNSRDGTFFGTHFGTAEDKPAVGDFDGDGKADISVFRPSEGNWYRLNSQFGDFVGLHFGAAEDKPAVGDFDGDGKADISLFRPSEGNWYRLNSFNGQFFSFHFGVAEDKPTPADYDGDGKTDISVFRPSEGNWYRLNSNGGTFFSTHFGVLEDKPVAADFDGDNKADIAVFRPSEGNWYILNSTAGFLSQHFGATEDTPTPNSFVY